MKLPYCPECKKELEEGTYNHYCNNESCLYFRQDLVPEELILWRSKPPKA